MMKRLMSLLSVPAMFALMFGFSAATAQPPGGQPPAGQPPAGEAPTIDDETREMFLDAYADIMEIQDRYAQQLQNATDEEQAMELQQAAQGEMQEAVAESGLSVEEYNQVIQAASANPELMAELEAAIEE